MASIAKCRSILERKEERVRGEHCYPALGGNNIHKKRRRTEEN